MPESIEAAAVGEESAARKVATGVAPLVEALDRMGWGVLVLTRSGCVASMNRAAEELTGYTLGAATHVTAAQVLNLKVGSGYYPLESQLQRVWSGEALRLPSNASALVSPDGREREVDIGISPLLSDQGATCLVVVLRDVHLERFTDVELRANEEKYRDLYENHPDMCVTVDAASERIVECNQTLARELGLAKQDIIGQTLDELYHPEGRPNPEASRAHFQRFGVLNDQERVLRRGDGSGLEVSLSVSKLIGADGRLYGKGVWRNISARKQGERDQRFLAKLADVLHETSEPNRLVFEVAVRLGRYLGASRAWFAEVDAERRQLEIARDHWAVGHSVSGAHACDAELSAAFGGRQHPGASVVGDTLVDFESDAARELAAKIAGRCFIAVPIVRGQRWAASLVIGHAELREWQDREVTLVQAVAERAWLWVERLRMAEALREREAAEFVRRSDARLRTLLDAVKDYAILQLDATGRIISWNSGATLLTGHSEPSALGEPFSIFYTPDARATGHAEYVLSCAARDGRFEEEGLRVRRDGSTFWANVLITPLYSPEGGLEGFAKITRDHTERRRVEEALEAQRAQLVARLDERDVLLQEVHHRVNNNLQLVSSLVGMQLRKLPHAAPRAALEECQARIRAIGAIHEKLYRAKDQARVPFSEYAAELAQSVFDATIAPGQNVKLHLYTDDVALPVDKAIPCGLILNELVTNALKHAFEKRDTGCLRVSLERRDATVSLTVADDGVGLDELAARQRGSLGLQLVNTLARQLQARLEIDSQAGTAISIHFTLDDF